jgi:hypothetical protein
VGLITFYQKMGSMSMVVWLVVWLGKGLVVLFVSFYFRLMDETGVRMCCLVYFDVDCRTIGICVRIVGQLLDGQMM